MDLQKTMTALVYERAQQDLACDLQSEFCLLNPDMNAHLSFIIDLAQDHMLDIIDNYIKRTNVDISGAIP